MMAGYRLLLYGPCGALSMFFQNVHNLGHTTGFLAVDDKNILVVLSFRSCQIRGDMIWRFAGYKATLWETLS
jgi:hypothetical protein